MHFSRSLTYNFNYRSAATEVKIYDSLFDSLTDLAKAQITSLLCSKQDIIEAHIVDAKLQVAIIYKFFQFQSGT